MHHRHRRPVQLFSRISTEAVTIDEPTRLLIRLRVAELTEQLPLVDRELEQARALHLGDRELADARLGRSHDPQTAAFLMVAAKMVRDHGRYLRLVIEGAKDAGVSGAALKDLAQVVGEVMVDAWLTALDDE